MVRIGQLEAGDSVTMALDGAAVQSMALDGNMSDVGGW